MTKPDQAPAAGYTLTARLVPDGQPRELGMTDRAGRIVLKPGFASGLVILRLLAGNVEPIVELPIMPGESVRRTPDLRRSQAATRWPWKPSSIRCAMRSSIWWRCARGWRRE